MHQLKTSLSSNGHMCSTEVFWTDARALAVKLRVRSCVRGQDSYKQFSEVDLDRLASCTSVVGRMSLLWSACGKDVLLIFGYWLLREFGLRYGTTIWELSVSKTDRSLGQKRLQKCLCPVPVAALKRVVDVTRLNAIEVG